MARHSLPILPDPALKLLKEWAEHLKEVHGVPVEATEDGLRKLVEAFALDLVSVPDAFRAAGTRFPLTLVEDILRSFPDQEALRIIRDEDLPRLAMHVGALEYLLDEETPFLTLPELAAHTQSLIQFLQEHRVYLIQTGLPPRYFQPCRWLYVSLGHLYDTRTSASPFPYDELFSTRKGTPEPQPFRWLRTSRAVYEECSYEQADILPGMSHDDAHLIEWNRSRVFQAKLHVIERLHDAAAAHRPSAEGLWQDCLAALKDEFTTEELEFFFRMDRFYLGEAGIEGLPGRIDAKLSPGGLTNLLQVIGHFEAEIQIGTLSRTRARMPDSLVQAFKVQPAAKVKDEEWAAAAVEDEPRDGIAAGSTLG